LDFGCVGLFACGIEVNALETFVLAVVFWQSYPQAGIAAYSQTEALPRT
jgi:hypothetical protein